MEKPEKEHDTFYITHGIELLIWLIVILFIVGFLTFNNIKHGQLDNDYSIFLPDIDGLIVGSPVRMMGIEIGHVTKIKPVNDEVYVKFLIKDQNLEIPQGTVATVEFSGMAGSKSLELYPPNEKTYIDKTTPVLTVAPPKRLHDAIGLLNDMFKQLGSIITTSSIFSKEIQTIELPRGTKEDLSDFLKYSDKVLDDSIKRAEDFEKRFRKDGK